MDDQIYQDLEDTKNSQAVGSVSSYPGHHPTRNSFHRFLQRCHSHIMNDKTDRNWETVVNNRTSIFQSSSQVSDLDRWTMHFLGAPLPLGVLSTCSQEFPVLEHNEFHISVKKKKPFFITYYASH